MGCSKIERRKRRSMLLRVGAERSVDLGKGKRRKKLTMICNQKSRRSVVQRRKVGLSGKGWEVKDGENESVVNFSVKQEKGILEWKNGKGMIVATETPAEDREREEEKLETIAEMGKEDMDLLVGCSVARRLRGMQKYSEMEDKMDVRKREEESVSDTVENRMHKGSCMSVNSSLCTNVFLKKIS
jgi:hypothetical protein